MADRIRAMRLNVSAGGLLVLILGVVFLIWPAEVITVFAQTIGLILLLIGITQLVGKLFSNQNKSSGMLVGALVAVVGFWIFVNPTRAASIIPIIIGVILVIHGVQNISLSFVARGYRMPGWGLMLAGGILNLLCGVICIVCAFATMQFVVQLSGAMLIYDGISSILTVRKLNRYEKDYIDAEYREL